MFPANWSKPNPKAANHHLDPPGLTCIDAEGSTFRHRPDDPCRTVRRSSDIRSMFRYDVLVALGNRTHHFRRLSGGGLGWHGSSNTERREVGARRDERIAAELGRPEPQRAAYGSGCCNSVAMCRRNVRERWNFIADSRLRRDDGGPPLSSGVIAPASTRRESSESAVWKRR